MMRKVPYYKEGRNHWVDDTIGIFCCETERRMQTRQHHDALYRLGPKSCNCTSINARTCLVRWPQEDVWESDPEDDGESGAAGGSTGGGGGGLPHAPPRAPSAYTSPAGDDYGDAGDEVSDVFNAARAVRGWCEADVFGLTRWRQICRRRMHPPA